MGVYFMPSSRTATLWLLEEPLKVEFQESRTLAGSFGVLGCGTAHEKGAGTAARPVLGSIPGTEETT